MDGEPAVTDIRLPAPPVAASVTTVHFGGPDQPPRALRDLLKARVDAAQAGSEILWVTYYFRDRALADALLAAHRRGVRVRVAVDARPRRESANAAVIAQLRDGLGDDLRLHRANLSSARLHAKIYAFTSPRPAAFVGSFNPSGDTPEDPEVVADIGDQDRGHNLLVEFADPTVFAGLWRQADRLWRGANSSRFAGAQNRPVRAADTELFFFPRFRPGLVEARLQALGLGDRVRAAVSHMDGGAFTATLAQAARRGAAVEVIVHDTRRRVPQGAVRELLDAGVTVRRYCHPERLPMHAKFILMTREGVQEAWFGSLNHNINSRYLNQEVLVRSVEPNVLDQLGRRFDHIKAETQRYPEC